MKSPVALCFRLATPFILALVTFGSDLHAQLPPAGDPPYVPTPMHLVTAMLDMAGVREGDVLYDLGSGDGRLVIAAAERGARSVGVEYEQWLVDRSWALAEQAGVTDRVEFRRQDLFATDVRTATVVTLYLGAEFNLRLRPILLDQLSPGSRVVSHAFHMAEWEPDSTRTIGTGAGRATLYYWIVPANVEGFWSLEIDGLAPSSLEFRQAFQELEVRASAPGGTSAIGSGSVAGTALQFDAALPGEDPNASAIFTGELSGGRLSGTVRSRDGTSRGWRARRFTDPALAPE